MLQKSRALVFALLIPYPLTEGVQTKPEDAATKGASSAVAPRTTDEDSIFLGLDVEVGIEALSGGWGLVASYQSAARQKREIRRPFRICPCWCLWRIWLLLEAEEPDLRVRWLEREKDAVEGCGPWRGCGARACPARLSTPSAIRQDARISQSTHARQTVSIGENRRARLKVGKYQ